MYITELQIKTIYFEKYNIGNNVPRCNALAHHRVEGRKDIRRRRRTENMMLIDVSGHESIEQRSSRFRVPPLHTGIKSSLLFLSLAVGILAVFLFILSCML